MNPLLTPTMKVFSMLVLAGGVFLGGMTGQALAGDKKYYDASLCQPEDGDKSGKYARFSGGIYNYDKGKTLKVDCAVVRDNAENINGLKTWGIAGRSMNPNSVVMCRMKSIDPRNGKFIYTGLAPILYSSSFKFRGVDLVDGRPRQKSISQGWSYYVLSCEIPPFKTQASALTSYYIEEY